MIIKKKDKNNRPPSAQRYAHPIHTRQRQSQEKKRVLHKACLPGL